jgi:hypothetical protein
LALQIESSYTHSHDQDGKAKHVTLGNNFPHFHVQFGAGMLLCEVGQQYGVIPHIGISSCLVVRGVFPQTRYVLG